MEIEAKHSERYDAALSIISRLVHHGYQALFAGGYVRDMIMGNTDSGDIDIATNATPETITRLFPQTIGVGENFGVMIVVNEDIPFEVATFRSDIGIKDGRHPSHIVYSDPKNDALRRDFTINGIFYDPLNDAILDYVGGGDDIKGKRIRAIGEPRQRFEEDYLRLLRAIRFAARFDFAIEQATWDAIVENIKGIVNISPERIFAELDKMLQQPHPDRALVHLHNSKLLPLILPEVENLAGIEQPVEFHPEGDVFVHTVKVLEHLPHKPPSILGWSALLHDIGKPATMVMADRIRFNNHHRVGAELAITILRRLRAPNWLTEGVYACVDNHMNFMNVTRMRLSTLKRFLSRPTIEDELELHRADCLASHGDLENYYFIKLKLDELAVEEIKPPPLLTGKDLIAEGLKPGPAFGEILNEVYDLQLEEQVTTKEEGLEYVRKHWGEKR